MPRKSIEQDKDPRERIVQSSSSADGTRMLPSESNESGLEQQDVGNKGSNPEPETPLAQDFVRVDLKIMLARKRWSIVFQLLCFPRRNVAIR
ncbi:MAG: hypothetical protein CM1200mP39_01990 [Dehalococcoidia bacterium]|nr:MAG: hypothetical protein CM1200mP39_01990 [Dehalococcoidia bacterium]